MGMVLRLARWLMQTVDRHGPAGRSGRVVRVRGLLCGLGSEVGVAD